MRKITHTDKKENEYVARFNKNDCEEVKKYIINGLSTRESFHKVIKDNKHNLDVITSIAIKYDSDDRNKWLIRAYEIDMQSIY